MRIQTTICTVVLIACLTPSILRGEFILDFQQGLLALRKGEKWGFIDKTGKWAISPEWDDVDIFHEDGLAIVTKDKKLGFVDTRGNLVIPATWFEARHMSGGVVAVRDETKWGLLNTDGTTVVEPAWEFVPPQVLDEGLFGFQVDYKARRMGAIDSKGKIVVAPRYDHIWPFVHGLAKVNRDGKAGFINRSGEEIIPLQYDYVSPFSEGGMATVQLGEKVGIINPAGKIVFEFEGDTMTRLEYDIQEKRKAQQGGGGQPATRPESK